jgi:uncharacterized membrane protein YccC
MAEFDASEFIDDDFQTARKGSPVHASDADRAPSREEVDSKVNDMQHKLAELKRAQQELERERSNLEELRRRQMEFTTSREEMVQHLTRGVGLLSEAEFAARRDAEQMSKALLGLGEALVKIEAVQEEAWTKDNLNTELTRALTTIENARMEWNSARLKFTVLNGEAAQPSGEAAPLQPPVQPIPRPESYAEMCKMGLALTWPVALVGLIILVVLLVR